MTNTGLLRDPDDAHNHRIACHRCDEPIEEWCETRRYGFWDEDAQNYETQPIEQRFCRDCWSKDYGRRNGAHFRPESAQQLWTMLDAADGSLVAIPCWWSGRPSIRVVDGEPEAAVTKPRDGGQTADGTPILKFESERIEGFDREEFDEVLAPPENEDFNLVRLLEPGQTAFAGLDGGDDDV